MPDFSFKFSWSEVINGLIGSFIFALLTAAAVFIWRPLRRAALSGRRARRRANYIDIWRRVKSDEYFASRQRSEIVLAIFTFTLLILAVQLLTLEGANAVLDLGEVAVISFALIADLALFLTMVWETACNQRATEYRIRIERRRRRPPRRARARRINRPSAGA
jgi:hypothetical protein